MAIILHGPGVRDPYPLERVTQEGGPAATQPTAAIRPVQDETGASAQAAARLRAAIRATQEGEQGRARALRAGELMEEALTLEAATPLEEARAALHRRSPELALVVDGSGQLIGLLDQRALLRAVWPPGERLRAGVESLSVGEVCQRTLEPVREEAPLELVLRRMLEQDGVALPVVDEAGKPRGIIHVGALLRVMLEGIRLEDWA